jgi:ATP-dependent helicase HepA
MPPVWREGAKLIHPFNPELGVGFVRKVEGRYLAVYFPSAEREVTLAAQNSGLAPLVMEPGAGAVVLESGEEVEIASFDGESYTLADGRVLPDAELWPAAPAEDPLAQLAARRLDRLGSFRNRVEGLRLMALREAGGLGSFLGGRIELFPHQLHTALRAVGMDPVRWLLADEVGLGKTIVACLILSALVRTGRARRALVIAPSTLTVQWLGELYRKFHQVFVLIDPDRIESVERDYGAGNNVFDVHPFAVVSGELLASHPGLAAQALEIQHELVVVDEAHRLSNPALEAAIAPLVRQAKHALLLTATPLAADRAGFHQLLALLHPEQFGELAHFEAVLASGEAVFPCTSAVRRGDLGEWPARRPVPVDLPPVSKDPRRDPRAHWLADQARGWLAAGEKALVFVRDLRALEKLRKYLESAAGVHISVFHEELSEAQRDIEVARFRESSLPLLLCSEAGAEGRNFQFCARMVHYDLPLDPVLLEQRIGRLDRIGRTRDVEIVYFRCAKAQPDIARLYERLDLFARPSAGLDAALAGVRDALRKAEESGSALDADALIASVEAARSEATRDLPRVAYRDAYDASQAAAILAKIPEDLEKRTRKFVLGAANDLGLKIVDKGGTALYYLELGTSLTVEAIPGVPEDSRWLGTFDRAEAIAKDELEFFASGHPLVEGLLLELEDGTRGRAAVFELPHHELVGNGLLCVYKQGPGWLALAVDARGNARPELAQIVIENLSEARPAKPEAWGIETRWKDGIDALADKISELAPDDARLEAAAFFRFIPGPPPPAPQPAKGE